MRFTNGFIKMERSLISEFDGDVAQLGLLTLLMGSVNWSREPKKYTKMGITYEVQYGQYITTYAILQETTGLSFRTLKGRLERLKTHGYISLKTLKNCMLIAVCIDKCQFTCSTDGTTNEEYKNIRNNIVPNGTMSKSPKKTSKKSSQFDSEGTQNLFDSSESAKNTPPVDERGAGGILTPNDLFKLWNEHCEPLAKVRDLSPKRIAAARLILKRISNPQDWVLIIQAVSQSKFHSGENDRGWKANFDFVIKDTNNIISKALEGSLKTVKKDRLNSYVRDIEIPY